MIHVIVIVIIVIMSMFGLVFSKKILLAPKMYKNFNLNSLELRDEHLNVLPDHKNVKDLKS